MTEAARLECENLPTGAVASDAHRVDQPAVGIGDEQLHSVQPAVAQGAEELLPNAPASRGSSSPGVDDRSATRRAA